MSAAFDLALDGVASPLDVGIDGDHRHGRQAAAPQPERPAASPSGGSGPSDRPGRNRSRRRGRVASLKAASGSASSPWRDRLLALLLPLALLALWWIAARREWIAPQVLPAPEAVGHTLWDLISSGELWDHLRASLLRVAAGFGVGLVGGLVLGTAMGLSPTIKDYLHPLFKAFAQVPVLGWLPLLMLLVGIDEALKIILISKAALVPIALNTCQGIENVPTRLIEVGRVLGFDRRQMLTRLVFPAALAPIWGGIRYGLTHAWLALVVVELLASSEGLGYLIVYGRQLFQLDMVLAAVVVVGIVGYALDKALAATEARLLRWRREAF